VRAAERSCEPAPRLPELLRKCRLNALPVREFATVCSWMSVASAMLGAMNLADETRTHRTVVGAIVGALVALAATYPIVSWLAGKNEDPVTATAAIVALLAAVITAVLQIRGLDVLARQTQATVDQVKLAREAADSAAKHEAALLEQLKAQTSAMQEQAGAMAAQQRTAQEQVEALRRELSDKDRSAIEEVAREYGESLSRERVALQLKLDEAAEWLHEELATPWPEGERPLVPPPKELKGLSERVDAIATKAGSFFLNWSREQLTQRVREAVSGQLNPIMNLSVMHQSIALLERNCIAVTSHFVGEAGTQIEMRERTRFGKRAERLFKRVEASDPERSGELSTLWHESQRREVEPFQQWAWGLRAQSASRT
jgi:hypothetical protein